MCFQGCLKTLINSRLLSFLTSFVSSLTSLARASSVLVDFVAGFAGMGLSYLSEVLYNRVMKITTKTGDKGETSLFGGGRVSKGSFVIEVLGELDELQTFLGWCRFVGGMRGGKLVCGVIDKIQEDIGKMMAVIGCHKGKVHEISEKDVEWMEGVMKKYGSVVEGLKGFVKPGTNEVSARFHVARSVCRRVERVVVRYFVEDDVEVRGSDVILKYLNRLSDFLFILGVKFR